MSFLIAILYLLLVPLSIFLVLVVLMQKSKSDGGVGAALGGGMTEATFGAETGNMLATITRNGTIAFFVICFALYLAQISRHKGAAAGGSLPAIEVPAEAAPVAGPEVSVETIAPAVEAAIESAPVAEPAN